MRILFLDDDKIRHKAFKRMHIGSVIKSVHTAKECIAALEIDEVYDVVSLDHDLGGEIFAASDKNSGLEVARYIRDGLDKAKYPKRVIVHSMNPIGAKRMVQTIQDAGVPVVWKMFAA
jgi:CheY-like chemotaxis protein